MFSNPSARMSVDSLSPASPPLHRSEFPFHRPGSASAQRRGSTSGSIHSIGGTLDTASRGWGQHSVLEPGQNAISTLLQPPIVRTGLVPHTSAPASSAHRPPTAKDIPPVALTNITHVDASEFKPYLTQVGALYEQLRRVRESEDEGADISNRRSSKQDDLVDTVDDGHLRPGRRPPPSRKSSVTSISSLSAVETLSPPRRTSSGFNRRTNQGLPPLSPIPTVYFDEDFHLENPRTFDVVSERSEVVKPAPGSNEERRAANGNAAPPRKALATNAILQEKLSWYMDTIEMHLISAISTASTTFFTVLGSLKDLHSEAAEAVDKIRSLRRELEALDREMATRGLDIVQKRRKRENLQHLHSAVVQLREIVNSVARCETLVDEGEEEKALDGIDALERLIAGEIMGRAAAPATPPVQLRDLRGAPALQGVNDDITTLRFRVGRAFEGKFLAVLLGDLRRHVEALSSREVLMRWSSASMRARGGHSREPSAFPTYLASTDELRAELFSALGGLQRAKHLTAATTAYKETGLREIRNLIRRPLPSSNDDDNESMMSSSTMGRSRTSQQEKSSILARNLRSMEPEDAEELLVAIYVGVTETLRRLTTQVRVLLDVASTLGEEDPPEPSGVKSPTVRSPPPFSPGGRRQSLAGLEAQEEIHKTLDLSNLLGQAVDIAQDKIVKLLRVRSEQSTHLPLVWFLRYFTLNLHFANECEAISGRSGTTLKTVVNGHIRDFVQQHGDAEKQKLAQGMELDQWSAKDFTDADAVLLDRILEGSTKDAAAWTEGTQVWIPQSTEKAEPALVDEQAQLNGGGGGKGKARSATIESETFVLPNSAVLCMDGMSHFLHLMTAIPSMTVDISSSLISYLQLFNSRCTQLILGAGATRSAGLKNITTKHLAISSQALSFIATLIPHVREFVRRHAGSGATVTSVMGEFDKVRRLFQEHQNSIYDKLVEIMSGRALAHSKTMRTIDWGGDQDKGVVVHAYMETLAKETTTLHRNLTKHLPEPTVRVIMVPVFVSYKDQLGKVLQDVDPKTEAGRNSMIRDVEFFESRLSKVDGFGDAGEYLLNIVKSKEVKKAPAPAAADNGESEAAKGEKKDAEDVKAASDDQKPEEKEDKDGDGKEETVTEKPDKE